MDVPTHIQTDQIESLEKLLSEYGYKVIDFDYEFCTDPKTHIAYVQVPDVYMAGYDDDMEDKEDFMKNHNSNLHLQWERRSACRECMLSMFCSLDCSGLYSNLRVFDLSTLQDVTSDLWGEVDEIDPTLEVWESEKDLDH